MGALIVHYVMSALVICLPAGNVYSLILNVEGYPAQLFALASSFGLIWLRFKRPDLRRPYKAWLSAVGIRSALSIALLIAPFMPRKDLTWREHLSQVSYTFVGLSVYVTLSFMSINSDGANLLQHVVRRFILVALDTRYTEMERLQIRGRCRRA